MATRFPNGAVAGLAALGGKFIVIFVWENTNYIDHALIKSNKNVVMSSSM